MKKNRSFVESAMRYRAIVFLICAVLVVFGIYGLFEIRKNEFPTFTVRQGVVVAVYPGANVNEVENRVTKPLEDFIFTYGEVEKKKTTSTTRDGLAIVQVSLNEDLNDKDAFWSKFKHGVQNFKSSLPAGVLAIVVMDLPLCRCRSMKTLTIKMLSGASSSMAFRISRAVCLRAFWRLS